MFKNVKCDVILTRPPVDFDPTPRGLTYGIVYMLKVLCHLSHFLKCLVIGQTWVGSSLILFELFVMHTDLGRLFDSVEI